MEVSVDTCSVLQELKSSLKRCASFCRSTSIDGEKMLVIMWSKEETAMRVSCASGRIEF